MRIERGLSQSKVALLLGISNGQIGNIESYKSPHKYTLAQLYDVCRELNFPIAELFIDEEKGETESQTIDYIIQKIIQYEQ